MSVGYLNQEGLYATKDINFSRYNFRSNISAKISKYLTADAQLSAHVQDKMAPYDDDTYIFTVSPVCTLTILHTPTTKKVSTMD